MENKEEESSGHTGKLQITIVNGKGFIPNNSYYFVIAMDFQTMKSQLSSSKSDQIDWNQQFTFLVDKPFSTCDFQVFDQNDNKIGFFEVPLIEFCDQKSVTRNFSFESKEKESGLFSSMRDLAATAQNTTKPSKIITVQLNLNYRYREEWNIIYDSILSLTSQPASISISLISQSIKQFPEIPNLYSFRSQAFILNGQLTEALEDGKKVIELSPNSGEGFYRIGSVYFAAEEFSQAEEAFKVGLEKDPQNVLCKNALDNIKKNALKQYLKRVLQKARNAIENGEFDLAISYYLDAITKNPGNYVYYIYRSVANILARHETEAMEDALKIIEIEPKWPGINPVKQSYLTKLGQYNLLISKKRWFILKEYFIYYYNSSSDSKPNGVILLGPDFDLQKRSKKHLYIVNPKRTWELSADTENERNEWLTILTKYLNTKIKVPQYSEELELQIFLEEEQISGKFEAIKNTAISKVSRVASVPVLAVGRATRRIKNQFSSVTFDNVIKEGFLFKKGELNTQWKKRYWILQGQTLYYLKAKQESNTAKPAGTIPLENTKIERDSKKLGKQFGFTIITPTRSFAVSAKSEDQMNSWIEAIEKVSGQTLKNSSTETKSVRNSINLRNSMIFDSNDSVSSQKNLPSLDQPQGIQVAPIPMLSSDSLKEKNDISGRFSRSGSMKSELKVDPKNFAPISSEEQELPKKPQNLVSKYDSSSSNFLTGSSLPANSKSFPDLDSSEIGDLQSLSSQPPQHGSFNNKRRPRIGTSENKYIEKFGLNSSQIENSNYTSTSLPKKDPLNLHAEFEPQDSILQPLLVRNASSSSFKSEREEKSCCSCIIV